MFFVRFVVYKVFATARTRASAAASSAKCFKCVFGDLIVVNVCFVKVMCVVLGVIVYVVFMNVIVYWGVM